LARDDGIAGMAQRLLAEAPPGPFALAGLSLGGIVAMEVVRQAPGRVAKLALIATNHRAAGAEFVAIRREQIARAAAGGLRGIVVDEMKAQYLGCARAGDQALRDLVLEMALSLGPGVFARQAEALIGRRDQSDALRRYAGRALLLCGAQDELCPVATHREMTALMPRGELVVLDGVGHLVTLEAPHTATAALRRWLDAC
jgi:pimeloyl-ACP methyl ester carboxylesterase